MVAVVIFKMYICCILFLVPILSLFLLNFCQLQHCWSKRYFASNASWCEVARRADAACVARPQICSFHRLGAPLYHTWVRPVYHTWVRPCTILGCVPVPYTLIPTSRSYDTQLAMARYLASLRDIPYDTPWYERPLPPNGGTGAKREECLVVPSLWQCSALFEAGAGQSRAIKGPAADLTDPASKPTTIDALPWHPLAHQRSYDHHLCSMLPFLALRANQIIV